jgi:thiamine kinase-like enzyme
MSILTDLEETMLFKGYKEYHRKLMPSKRKYILSHNDINATNILLSNQSPLKVSLIDYEFAGWQPTRAMDLASYFNKTMIDTDYKHHPSGIGLFLENLMSDAEVDSMIEIYLRKKNRLKQ